MRISDWSSDVCSSDLPVTRDPYVKPAPSGFRKDILIVVKDEQTGLPLSGVKVDIRQGETVYTSITNVNGEAERIEKAAAGRYEVTGIKNGIEATGVVIGAAEIGRASCRDRVCKYV